MPFISIAKLKTWTHGGKIYESGVHEVSAAVAARANVLRARYGWSAWMNVTDVHPGDVVIDPNARAGTLTKEDVMLGSDAAAAAAAAAATRAVEDAAAAKATQAKAGDGSDAPLPFPCDHDECDREFPTKAARTRHMNVNHKPEDADAAPTAPETTATVADDGDTAVEETTPENDDKAADDQKDDE